MLECAWGESGGSGGHGCLMKSPEGSEQPLSSLLPAAAAEIITMMMVLTIVMKTKCNSPTCYKYC